ncbi:hypothetical protein F01_310221 [Burkholderia cenocepacia]|nr:hypothetical protein F01_310221 [Burkholderia cenocepacia]
MVRGGRRRADRESRCDHPGDRVGVPVGLLPRRPRMDAVHVHAREPGPQARGRRADAGLPHRVRAAVRVLLVQRDRRRLPRPDRARGVIAAALREPGTVSQPPKKNGAAPLAGRCAVLPRAVRPRGTNQRRQ